MCMHSHLHVNACVHVCACNLTYTDVYAMVGG